MRVSSKAEYACRAMLELAQRAASGETCTAAVIAEQRQIPEQYLVQILLQLKRAGLVQSIRGAQGGYRLGLTPDQISLLEIIEAMDGPVEEQLPGRESASPEFVPVWRAVSRGIRAELGAATLQRIMEGTSADEMYHI